MKQIAALVLFAAACSGQLLYGAAPYAGLPHAGLPITGLPLTGLPYAAGVGYSGLPLTYASATGLPLTYTSATGLPLTYTAASGLPLTYAAAAGPVATTAVAPALRDGELEKVVNNPGHATSYRVRPDIPEASRKRRDLTAISGLPLPYSFPYVGSHLAYTAGSPVVSGLPLTGAFPLTYAAGSVAPVVHAAVPTTVPVGPALRDGELEKIVNNPGHATSYRVRPDIA